MNDAVKPNNGDLRLCSLLCCLLLICWSLFALVKILKEV